MGDERREAVESNARLELLEQRFDSLETRLTKLEARAGIASDLATSILTTETPPVVEETSLLREKAGFEIPTIEKAPIARVEPEPTPLPPVDLTRWEVAPQVPEPARFESQPSKPRREMSFNELEERITGRLLAWVGGLALIVGAIFFLSLAFSRGWIGPTARVTVGLFAGALLVVAGGWFFERRDRLFGNVLTPVGLGILSLSFFAGTQLYDLFPVQVGLAGALVSAVAAAVIAIRADSQLIAAYGLITALSAPIVLGASPSGGTIAFLSTALIGTTIVALYRSWRWLPVIAFLLAAPQVSDFLTSDVSIAAGMIALWAFWLLNAIAAGGEEFRRPSNRLGITSTTLLVANAVFIVSWGFYLLQGDTEWWRGPFLVGVAAAHMAMGGYFLVRRGDHHPFGMLAFGTGIAAASMALPVQLGGPPVPIGWAAEAAALAWVYANRKHGYSGLMAIALGALAIGHLVLFEYPIDEVNRATASTWPFLNANGGTLAFLLAAIAVSIVFVRRWDIGVPAAAVGGLLVVYALPFETSGLLLVGLWAALFVLGVAVDQRLLEPRLETPDPSANIGRFAAYRAILVTALIAGAASVLHVLAFELPMGQMDVWTLPSTPFWDSGTVAAVILIVALLASGWLTGRARTIHGAILASFGVAAYLLPFELRPAAMVVGWSVLALISLALAHVDNDALDLYGAISGVLIGIGSLVVLYDVAPPSRLMVSADSLVDHPLFWSGATIAIGSIVLVLFLMAMSYRSRDWVIVFWLLAAFGFVYLLSVGVVDDVQRRIGGSTSLEELQKQAQVALSILWAVLGGMAVVIGLWRGLSVLRGAGLALLGIVTAKVFIYDLSSLDAAYRVLSFFGLGALLLISAYLYQHIGPHDRHPTAA